MSILTKSFTIGLLPLLLASQAQAESYSEKKRSMNAKNSKQLEKILTCNTNEMPSNLVPLIYKLSGHSTFNRRDSYIGEYTLLPETVYIFNQPVESIYISKFMGDSNKDYYQYTSVLPENANVSILAKAAGFAYDAWDGKYIKNGNNKVQINFENGKAVISCIQPVLSYKPSARPSAIGGADYKE